MSVLEKASDLIDCLGRAGEPVTLGHVRSALGMPKSSTHRLLSELAALGIVRRTEDGRYSLGPRLLYWGEAAADTFDLRAVADQPMRRLRDAVGESVHLYVREHDTRICIAAVEGRHELRPFIQLGRPLPLRVGAAGKLLLAFADGEVQELELERALADTPPCRTRRARGCGSNSSRFGLSAGRHRWASARGVSAAATAIVDSRDRVVAALCISAPSTRLGPAVRGDEATAAEECCRGQRAPEARLILRCPTSASGAFEGGDHPSAKLTSSAAPVSSARSASRRRASRRTVGPEIVRAACTAPDWLRIGAAAAATPSSRSPNDTAHSVPRMDSS